MSTETGKPSRLQVFLRSGNSFVLDGVMDWKVTSRENRTVGIWLRQLTDDAYTRLIVGSLDLDQIEAVLMLPEVAA